MNIPRCKNLLIMLIPPVLLLCECEEPYSQSPNKKIVTTNYKVNEKINLVSFFVPAKYWEIISPGHRVISVPINEITEKVINHGVLKVYMHESDKSVGLPFTYYQLRRAMSIEPSWERGKLSIHIYGNFIVNINSGFKFKLLIINTKLGNIKRFIDWDNYAEVKEIFKF